MIDAQAQTPAGVLPAEKVFETLHAGLDDRLRCQKVLVLIPDHTRSLPLPLLFRGLVEVLCEARQLDFMVALGTHPPLDEAALCNLLGISSEERMRRYKNIGLLNHTWGDPASLATIGNFQQDEIRQLARPSWHPSLPEEIPIRLNKAALTYDHILILGPTSPHEVAGFSGGAKYLFPGISGPEMIHATHWLGALAGVVGTIGIKDTPVRSMIHAAAARLSTPVTLVGVVVEGHGLAGIFIGDLSSAWSAAAELSAQRHICWVEKPFRRVLACALPRYDELWTAAKAMYKLEPAVAVGGEVIIYAPHLKEVSRTHGKYIYEIGYHILPYFLQDWERFRHIPLGVLAHSTHLRGAGQMENGVEKANLRVTLASQIPPEDCARLNLGYLDPAGVHPADWQDREKVTQAGEILYRLKGAG